MGNPNGTPANLTPWKPGQSGNPSGRPKLLTISEAIRLALEKRRLMGMDIIEGMDGMEALGESIVFHAIQGSAQHAKIALERTEGKVPNPNPMGHLSDEELLAQLKGDPGGSGPPGAETAAGGG